MDVFANEVVCWQNVWCVNKSFSRRAHDLNQSMMEATFTDRVSYGASQLTIYIAMDWHTNARKFQYAMTRYPSNRNSEVLFNF